MLLLDAVQQEVSEEDEENEVQIKALVVDDSNIDRLILQKMLLKNGYDVYVASDGHMAIDMFKQCQPDIVFMDLYLPETSGYEITRNLKRLSEGKYVPIIFVTGATDDKSLEDCLDSGGDDFIVKPVKESLLKAKVGSLLRIKQMHDQVLLEKEVITNYSKAQTKDMHDANEIIENIRKPHFNDTGNIKYSLQPQYIISGDLLCSVVGPSGNHVILVGDNTGHGLPAAIGSMIIYDVFYSMVRKGYGIEDIIEEINFKLYRLLPSDRFFAATFIEIHPEYEIASIWNAGMPDVIVTNGNGTVKQSIASMHMPLGIINLKKDDVEPVNICITSVNRIYAYSDGVTELFDKYGEQYGEKRLLESLRLSNPDERFDHALNSLTDFMAGFPQTDDILFVEINCDIDKVSINREKESSVDESAPMNWSLNLNLQADAIKYMNPVPVILQSMIDLQGLQAEREKLFMILSEMYSNALEHGVLGLCSSIKEQEDGFVKYYEQRQSGLEGLDEASLSININNHVENKKGIVSITVEDSGQGFDYSELMGQLQENEKKSGRGIGLIADLSRNFEYSNDGKTLKVEYEWDSPVNDH